LVRVDRGLRSEMRLPLRESLVSLVRVDRGLRSEMFLLPVRPSRVSLVRL
jgi:hypothetical protein